jgi:5-methyltetrahydrofolate--homocysteine methyltransferase
MSKFLDALKDRVLVTDGSMGVTIFSLNLTADDYDGKEGCIDYLSITKPEVIQKIHESFLEVGCDVVETNTFGANRIKLKEFGLDNVYEINKSAVEIANNAVSKFDDKERFVAGSIGPSGLLLSSTDPELSNISFNELVEVFKEQALGLIDGKVDVFIIETQQDILETKATIIGVKEALAEKNKDIPIVVQVTLDINQKMLLGTDVAAALTTLDCLDVDIIGMNCSTGPSEMTESVRFLCNNTNKFVSCIPNAGLPVNVNGKAEYKLSPEEFTKYLTSFVKDFGVNLVGGCCGTTKEHIKELVGSVKSLKPRRETVQKVESVSSALNSVSLIQEPRPLLVGERTNATGSKKFRDLLKNEDYDAILDLAKEQVEHGAHVLDVSTAHNDLEKGESYYMKKLIKKFSTINAPLMIDSTEPEVIEKALQNYPGKAIINSVNFERNSSLLDEVFPLVKKYGAAVVALPIDDEGMAQTKQRKLDIAEKIYQKAKDYGINTSEILFDFLTFTLATGEDNYKETGIATFEAIKEFKARHPEIKTSLGVSNVSFGLKPVARKVLNSVFLHHAIEYGLDAAIVHAGNITPYSLIDKNERELMDNLIFNKENALKKVVDYYEDVDVDEVKKSNKYISEELSVEERIHNHIVYRISTNLEKNLDECLKKYTALEIINTILIKAMKDVGDRFGKGEFVLPFVLDAANIMKKAMDHLEKFLDKDQKSNGTIILATVYGDVHDIGKNLVKTVLENNGFKVLDLGKAVSIAKIIDEVRENKPVALGLSALLVSTSQQMKAIVEELHKNNLAVPVIVGGAAVSEKFAKQIGVIDGDKYVGRVHYAKTAFDGLEIVLRLIKK